MKRQKEMAGVQFCPEGLVCCRRGCSAAKPDGACGLWLAGTQYAAAGRRPKQGVWQKRQGV